MLFEGQTIKLDMQDCGIAELKFERGSEAVNKLDGLAFDELRQALGAIRAAPAINGVLITSAKDTFIVGADIFEFTGIFKQPEEEIAAFVAANSALITALADLPVPTAAAINGLALGGGFEVALAADYRVIATTAKVGVPEIHLGIFPGYGGTVRLPRLIGLAESADWIISGAQQNAEKALQAGAADAVAMPDELLQAARALLQTAIASNADWQERRQRMTGILGISKEEAAFLLGPAKAQAAKAMPHLPAAHFAVELLEKASGLARGPALALEAETFGKVAKTQAAGSLVAIFVNEQAVKKTVRRVAKDARPVRKAAVAGAGIMGGGIAYQSALSGVPIVMKDISEAALDLGMSEARKLLDKSVESGRLARDKADSILASIAPGLGYEGFEEADVAVEAVVENLGVKHKVLREIEALLRPGAILASNTSSLRIADLAEGLRRPENFLGMHFFNPVPRMPLVEVVRGPKTSAQAIAAVTGYAAAMGKTPIVVEDCPGFVVNRVLTPYFIAFLNLVHEGAGYQEIDKAMEAFGWPMGPAYLMDVIGMDVSGHVVDIVSAGFAPRMNVPFETAIQIMLRAGRLGQKNGLGFYKYESDAKGRPRKIVDEETQRLLAPGQPNGKISMDAGEITSRMMLPLILEAARCAGEKIAASPGEVDMCLILGLGLPRYLGGALKYADYLGLKNVVDRAGKWAGVSPIYRPSERLLAMASAGEVFYPL
ncbi:MAG: fatty acid oxidation complex subunit alpha FadB [Beijerinckiaceae bacterium]|nr:fatty acid oxidation complex subunit alpha FadB [Beijerinckiaceae bacterium]